MPAGACGSGPTRLRPQPRGPSAVGGPAPSPARGGPAARPGDRHGLLGVDTLAPQFPELGGMRRSTEYYHSMIRRLEAIGYEEGATLFGFPYDWRQSVWWRPALARLAALIERASSRATLRSRARRAGGGVPSGGDDDDSGDSAGEIIKVDLVTHSLGGLVAQAYLAAGYKIVEMWEHDFKEAEKHNGLLLGLLRRRAPCA